MMQAIQRILNKSGRNDLVDFLSREMPLSDLNTLLLEVYGNITRDTSYGDLLEKYFTNRFVQPAELNPIVLKQLEIDMFKIAQASSFQPIQLSPVANLGSCSVVATVNQNKILSASRGTEVVADATNAIALHICGLIKTGKLKNEQESIRFCTSHRHVRTQKFNAPGLLPHFNLFCMVVSGRDRGSYSFEKQTLCEQINVYQKIFKTLFNTNLTIRLKRLEGYKDSEGLIQRLSEYIKENMQDITVAQNMNKTDNSYYKGMQFTIIVNINGHDIEIGDGGFVDWSQKLLGNKKERMMISAIGLERLVHLLMNPAN